RDGCDPSAAYWTTFASDGIGLGIGPDSDTNTRPRIDVVILPCMNWLFKEEPTHYGFDALVKDKKTVWSGVKNPLAQKHLRSVKKGDRIFYYHTGDEKAVVGIATAVGDAYPDPNDKTGKSAVVDVAPVKKL